MLETNKQTIDVTACTIVAILENSEQLLDTKETNFGFFFQRLHEICRVFEVQALNVTICSIYLELTSVYIMLCALFGNGNQDYLYLLFGVSEKNLRDDVSTTVSQKDM